MYTLRYSFNPIHYRLLGIINNNYSNAIIHRFSDIIDIKSNTKISAYNKFTDNILKPTLDSGIINYKVRLHLFGSLFRGSSVSSGNLSLLNNLNELTKEEVSKQRVET